jgi:integrase
MKLKTILNEARRTDWQDAKSKHRLVAMADEVLDYFGDDTDIRTLDYRKVLDFTDHLKARDLTGSTINRYLSALSKLFTVARRFDPKVQRVEIPLQKEGKPRQRILTDGEREGLVNYPWSREERRDLTVLLMDTGIRPGEVVKGEWHVQGDELTLMDTKNGDDRTIILTPDAKGAALRLRKYFDKGGSITYSKYYDEFIKARDSLGMGEDVVIYTLRHTAITRLAEATENVLLIQKWAGHKNLQTTQRYVKATRKGMENLAQVLRRN